MAIRWGWIVLVAALGLPAHAEDELDSALEEAAGSSVQARSVAEAQPPTTSDPQVLCVFYHRRGLANQRLGNYERALADLRLALEHNQDNRLTTNDLGSRNRIIFDLGNAIEQNADWPGAIAHWNERISQAPPKAHPARHSYHLRLAQALSTYGQFADAAAALKAADAELANSRNTRNWPDISDFHLYFNRRVHATHEVRRGNLADAERLFRDALRYAEANLRARERRLGAEHLALRSARDNVSTARLSLASFLSSRGKAGEAEYFSRLGVDERMKAFGFNTTQVAGALSNLGWAKFQQGNVAAARRYYGYAVKALEGSGVPDWSSALANHRASLATTYLAEGRWHDALPIYERRDAALRANAEQYKRAPRTQQGMMLAMAKTGRADEAARITEVRLSNALKNPFPAPYQIAQWRGALGVAKAKLGRTGEATELFKLAIPVLGSREGDDGDGAGFYSTFWHRTVLEAYMELLAAQHAATQDPARREALADEAFRPADAARGSGVQQAISGSAARASLPEPALAELARKDQDAKNRIESLYQVVARLAAAPDGKRPDKVIAEMRADIERLRKDRAVFASQMRTRFPEYAELVDPRPVGLAQAWGALGKGEALVAVYLGEGEAYVWTIANDGRRVMHVAPVARRTIDADVAKLRAAVDLDGGDLGTLPAFDVAAAHRIYAALLAPGASLWEGARVLNLIPHGSLGQLPAAMLVTEANAAQPPRGPSPAYRDAPWLAKKVAVAQLPSASAFVALKRTPESKLRRRPFAGFGDPVFSSASGGAAPSRNAMRNLKVSAVEDAVDQSLAASSPQAAPSAAPQRPAPAPLSAAFSLLGALPDTADELREIGTLLKANMAEDVFLGERATEGNVKRAVLSDRRVIAFATHGLRAGELSGLDQPALALSNPALAPDKDNDGFLTMEEVLGLKLDADWVILSACNTASGGVQEGEAVSGLGRAFFYAGARSLLVSNWAVESSSARLLTTELFKRQSADAALTRAEALRQSMLDLMGREGTAGGSSFSYAHPLFWAPFSLVGDSGVRR